MSHYLSNLEHSAKVAALLLTLVPLAACGTKNTADTYSQSSVQRASKVEPGVLIGMRKVVITADSSSGSQGSAAIGALVPFGGAVAGGIINSAVAQGARDYTGYEYIVRKPNGDMVSVTQADKVPLRIGEHVLIIEGPQARIVTDYTVPIPEDPKPEKAEEKKSEQTVKPAPVQTAPAQAMPIQAAPATAISVDSKPEESKPGGTPDAAQGVIVPPTPIVTPATTTSAATPEASSATQTQSTETPTEKQDKASGEATAPAATPVSGAQ